MTQFPNSDDSDQTKKLQDLTERRLDDLVSGIARELGVEKRWVLAEVVYVSTQRMRSLGSDAKEDHV